MKLKLIRTENYAEMSLEAGKIIVERIRSNPAITLGLATGSTLLVDDRWEPVNFY